MSDIKKELSDFIGSVDTLEGLSATHKTAQKDLTKKHTAERTALKKKQRSGLVALRKTQRQETTKRKQALRKEIKTWTKLVNLNTGEVNLISDADKDRAREALRTARRLVK